MNILDLNLMNYPNLKKYVYSYIDRGGASEKPGCIPLFVYFFKKTILENELDPDEIFGWPKEIADDFWSWGHNSRWAHTACMWIEDNFNECLEKAVELAKEYGDPDLEKEEE